MEQCFNCDVQTEIIKGWFTELTNEGKIMRCPKCGNEERNTRWNNLYPNRPLEDIEDIDKQDRIQYAKDMRSAKISPWNYHE